MNDAAMQELSLTLMKEIEDLLIKNYGKDYTIKFSKSKDMYTLCTDSFILFFSIPDQSFFLTFMLNQSGKKVANIVKLLMVVLDYTELTVMDDSYYDKDKDELVFGMEAINVKNKQWMKSMGKSKCIFCERIFPAHYVNEKGICKLCEENKSKYVWH